MNYNHNALHAYLQHVKITQSINKHLFCGESIHEKCEKTNVERFIDIGLFDIELYKSVYKSLLAFHWDVVNELLAYT